MNFDYEKSIWGHGFASAAVTSPTGLRLRKAVKALQAVKSGSVLEFGCGAGQFIRSVKKMRPDLNAYGCDISSRAIAEAKDFMDSVNYEVCSETLPYADNFFEAVLVFDVLEHVEDPAAVLIEIKRVLKPGGILYSFVPCEGDSLSFWNLLRKFGWKKDLTRRHAGHIHYFSRHSLGELYRQVGFKNVIFRYSEHFLGQILGIVVFVLMDRTAKNKGLSQINGEDYFRALNKRVKNKNYFSLFKKFVNFLVYIESVVFLRIPSPNVHVTAKK